MASIGHRGCLLVLSTCVAAQLVVPGSDAAQPTTKTERQAAQRGRSSVARPALSPALTIDAQVALNGFQALVETQLQDVGRTLRVLAATSEVQTGDFATMRPLLEVYAGSGVPAAAVWFAEPSGTYSTVDKGTAGTLFDRPYFPRLIAGESVTGSLVISRSTGERAIVVAEPVRRGDRIVGAIGVSLSVEALGKSVDQALGMPPGVVFYALDEQGQTALHRDPKLMFAYPSDLGDPSLKSAVREMRRKHRGQVSYTFRGASKAVLYQHSSVLGWVFALGFETRK